MSTQAQAVLKLSIKRPDGSLLDTGIWDKMTGGEIDSDTVKYRPGNMAPAIVLGGSVEVGDVTLSRLYELSRDAAIIHDLIELVGKGSCALTRQALDADGHVWGTGSLVYTATLKTVTPPEIDSESTDAALIEVTISPTSTIGEVRA